ncbi:MAG: hypothetical protein ACI8XO_003471 [Verrucomicrobiales bacterium]|jgi:hypothetical protein
MPFLPKAIIFLVIAGALAFFLDKEERRGGFEDVDRQYRSWLMANSEAEILEPSVTFLAIDDPGERVFDSWPLGPVDYSILVDNLAKTDPRVIAVTPVLGWRDGVDDILLSSMRSVLLRLDENQVLLGAELMLDPSAGVMKATTMSLFPQLEKVDGDRSKIPEFTRVAALPEPALTAISPSLGFTRIDLGEAGAERKRDSFSLPLMARNGQRVVASFVLMAIVKESGVGLDQVSVSLEDKVIRIGAGEGELEIPIDSGGRLSVHTGIRDAISKHNAEILILMGAEDIRDQLTEPQKESLLSRIVILGADDEVARTIDLPKSREKISRAELFAMAIATIQAKRFIQKVPRVVEVGIWAGLAALGLLILRVRGKGGVMMWWIVLLILFVISSLMLFQYTGQWGPVVVPGGMIASVLLVAMVLATGKKVEEAAEPDEAAPT